MTDLSGKLLSEIVGVARHYQRSIRIDTDLGSADALDGYVCHRTASMLVESMSRQVAESSQRAFTWTGPYGGGKSSLAVALASAVGPDKKLRAQARALLNIDEHPLFDKAFPVRRGWLVVPVVGKRAGVAKEIHKALRKARGLPPDARKSAASSLISDLLSVAGEEKLDGTLLVIDELGKFLEASALGYGDDVYFFQELAEAARVDGRLVIVGILHQSFGQYATRLGMDSREDWAKIQGRYSDIPLVAAGDEIIGLLAKAIEAQARPPWAQDAADAVAEAIRVRRPSVGAGIGEELAACWPLHPAMAALLGPASKRQFGQNERSVFGFLSSPEPHGFRSYLENTKVDDATWYRPDHFFDYLRSNLEPAILSSPDGHRWAQAVDAVDRAEAKSGDVLALALIKCVAVIDLFKNGSGLAAEPSVLRALFANIPSERVDSALADLARWRVAIFKKHSGAWSVFEGSDFDIESALAQARAAAPAADLKLLSRLADPYLSSGLNQGAGNVGLPSKQLKSFCLEFSLKVNSYAKENSNPIIASCSLNADHPSYDILINVARESVFALELDLKRLVSETAKGTLDGRWKVLLIDEFADRNDGYPGIIIENDVSRHGSIAFEMIRSRR